MHARQPTALSMLTVCGSTQDANKAKGKEDADYYRVSVKQISQKVLPDSYPETTVIAYGPTDSSIDQYSWPAKTFEATVGATGLYICRSGSHAPGGIW